MSAGGPSTRPSPTAERLAWIAVCAAACLPYLRTIPDYFVQDDFGVVQLLARKPWSTFPQWFAMPWMEDIWGYLPDEIRPFPALSYQITALGGEAAPEAHHLLNILLHAANALLVMAIARRGARLGLLAAATAGVAFALLPVGAESVAWITGRVDSLPALFYLASFLAYVQWRLQESPRLYVWSLVWFFLALFSKQNTITMAAALVAFDVMIVRRPIAFTWRWLRPYVPFLLMTAGFLALRYVLLGEVLRESQLSAQRFAEAGGMVARHLQRIVYGEVGMPPRWALVLGISAAMAWVLAAVRTPAAVRGRVLAVAAYFGPVWLLLGIAPAIAAGYESPRHTYLAAAGWAILIGSGFELLSTASIGGSARRALAWRRAVALATAVVLGAYGVRLTGVVAQWSARAAVSERATRELERQVLAAPAGALVIAAAPVASWEWAAPFMARPPYTSSDLTARVGLITPRRLHCCRGQLWDAATRGAIAAWLRRPGTPAIALHVDASGEIRRLTSSSDPELASLVNFLPQIPGADNLDEAIEDILRTLVAGRGEVIAGITRGTAAPAWSTAHSPWATGAVRLRPAGRRAASRPSRASARRHRRSRCADPTWPARARAHWPL